MSTIYKTPGVYIEEKNAFPNSVVAPETAIPVFIGYTEMAIYEGISLLNKPTRINSLVEYVQLFGKGFQAKYTLVDADPNLPQDTFDLNGNLKALHINEDNTAYLFNSIRLFYANGGGACYILSVGTYSVTNDTTNQIQHEPFTIQVEDFIGSDTKEGAFEILKRELEPTLLVMPDAIALGEVCYSQIYTKALLHCAEMQLRMAILDLINPPSAAASADIVQTFRDQIGMQGLSYGAAYYPWLHTSMVSSNEVNFENLDASVDLENVLPNTELAAIDLVKKFKATVDPDINAKQQFHQQLTAMSPTYATIMEKILHTFNQLPPSGAIAGVYTMIDNSRGVWKAPANVSMNGVIGLSLKMSDDEQQSLNIDVNTGKSINAIRQFTGKGFLVWGARTLDGNSQEWRYINVRRTIIMIEQSIKLAMRAYVFEPNNANTWITVKSMITLFLTNLWNQGALAGTKPEHAFFVNVGLGATMSDQDILDGKMILTVGVALARPAEFIIISLEQQMQKS